MLTKLKISLCIRVSLLVIPCLIYLLTRIFITSSIHNETEGDDKKSVVFTSSSSQRRLLGIMEQHESNTDFKFTDFFSEIEASNDHSSRVFFQSNKSTNDGSDIVRWNIRIITHVLVACYCFWMIAIICDEYFMASIHIFCHKLKIKRELASGTFMTMATSSPELCISCVGTFMAEGDMTIGAIVGSAIFNILVITACCGILTRSVSKVDVYLLSRDCFSYGCTIIGLIAVIYDHLIMWHEAVLMVTGYGVYLIMMYKSDTMSKKMKLIVLKIKTKFSTQSHYTEHDYDYGVTEITPLFMRDKSICNQNAIKESISCCNTKLSVEYEKLVDTEDDDDCATNPWRLPRKSNIFLFILKWPITFVLWCTIPDCRRYEKFYIITFINCVAWILGASYLIASMVANVDSILGFIFLGACTSIPEAVSSVITTLKGHADIAINNAISSNIFDILLCLGLPWSARTMIVPLISGKPWITLTSTGITYSAISLLATLFIFYFLFVINRFSLDRKIGISCLITYLIFLILSLMLELNLFRSIQLPSIGKINGLI